MESRPSHAVDIRMVAKRARVSIATVSRALNKVASVDPSLAARVVKAAQEMSYTPNPQARALVSGRSGMIGLIVSQITNPFFPELIQSFEDLAVRRGYEILIGSTNYSPERMMQCVRRMVERKVEGVAVMTFGMEEELLQELSQRGISVVSVGSTQKLKSATSIEVDYGSGIREAVQHLAVLGHREISFISGPLSIPSANLRQIAYVKAMAQIGIKVSPHHMIEGDHTMEGGYAAAERLFARSQMPTAIVCSNDLTAIGVLHAVSGHGWRVPDDISIIGFDDIQLAQFTVPPLTSVRMGCSDLAAAALDALPLQSQTTTAQIRQRPLVPTRLIVRQTSGYPRIRKRPSVRSDAAPAPARNVRQRKRPGLTLEA
jgi:LacI family transcriptional regulator